VCARGSLRIRLRGLFLLAISHFCWVLRAADMPGNPNFIGDFSFWPVYSEVQTHVGPLILLGTLMFLIGSSGRTRTYNPSVNSRLRGLTHHGPVSLSDSKQTLTPESAKPGEASSGAKFVQKFVQLHAEMPAKFWAGFLYHHLYPQKADDRSQNG